MKILYLHQYFATPEMGMSSRSYELGRRLVLMGHTVTVITSDMQKRGKGWSISSEGGMQVHWLSNRYSNTMTKIQRIKSFLRFALLSIPHIKKTKYNIVYATSTPLTIAIPGVIAAKIRHVPMVLEIRDIWPKVPIRLGIIKNPIFIYFTKILEKFAYFNATRIVALAPGMKNHIVSLGVREDLISVIPNGCDVDIFSDTSNNAKIWDSIPWGKDSQYLVYAGTMGDVNGTEWIVRVANECLLMRSNIKFIFIGEGKRKEQTKALSANLGILNVNTVFLPRLKKSDLAPILKLSVGSFVTVEGPKFYLNDSVGNKLFDALSAGTPIFSNHHGYAPDIAEKNGCGVILQTDTKEAAKTLIDRVNNKDWMMNARRKALFLANTVFSRDEQAKTLEIVLSNARNVRTKKM